MRRSASGILLYGPGAVAAFLACCSFFFFFNDTATTEIYTLSLHDALPIYRTARRGRHSARRAGRNRLPGLARARHIASGDRTRSEEHTSELQSPCNLVCRLLLEKKKEPITQEIIRKTIRKAERRNVCSRAV